MTYRILITPEGDDYVDGDLHDATGISLEWDMDPRDNLPARVIPCPERREYKIERLGVRG